MCAHAYLHLREGRARRTGAVPFSSCNRTGDPRRYALLRLIAPLLVMAMNCVLISLTPPIPTAPAHLTSIQTESLDEAIELVSLFTKAVVAGAIEYVELGPRCPTRNPVEESKTKRQRSRRVIHAPDDER